MAGIGNAAAKILKKTTGITGLKVAKDPHHALGVLYGKILKTLQDLPQDAAYRKYTEQIVTERYNHVKAEPSIEKLEGKIKCGQIEEVIQQAENELMLARKMVEWKPWQPLIGQAPGNQWKWPVN